MATRFIGTFCPKLNIITYFNAKIRDSIFKLIIIYYYRIKFTNLYTILYREDNTIMIIFLRGKSVSRLTRFCYENFELKKVCNLNFSKYK